MSKVILTCKCGQTPKYAEDSFKILFPGEEVPPVYSGGSRISDILPFILPGTPVYNRLRALVRSKEKFAYYLEWDNDDEIIQLWDLKAGRRVA